MSGVLLGTVFSYGYRSLEMIFYTEKYLLPGTLKRSLSRIIRNALAVTALTAAGICCIPQSMNSFVVWFLYAVTAGVVSAAVIVGINYLFEPEGFRELMERLKRIIKK